MRRAPLTVLLIFLFVPYCHAQSSGRADSSARWDDSNESRAPVTGDYTRQRQQLADSIRRARSAEDAFPIPDNQRAQASDYRDPANRVEPAQYRASSWPNADQPDTSTRSTAADPSAEDFETGYQTIYTPPTQADSQYGGTTTPDPFQNSAELPTDNRTYADRGTGTVNDPTVPTSQAASPGGIPTSRDVPSATAGYAGQTPDYTTPQSTWDGTTTTSARAVDPMDASPLRATPSTDTASPPVSAYDSTARAPQDRRATTGRREYPINVLLLFASIGLNVYLSWIAVDTYNRYQDLVSDMRTTRSRRDHGDSDHYADDQLESTAY